MSEDAAIQLTFHLVRAVTNASWLLFGGILIHAVIVGLVGVYRK